MTSNTGHTLWRCAMVWSIGVVLLLVAGATAQEQGFSAGAGQFACQGGAAFPPVDDQYRGISAVVLDGAPKDLPPGKPRSFGPFANAGLKSVEFYQSLAGDPQEGSMATETELRLYVHVKTANRDLWYALQARDPAALKADPAGAQDSDEAAGETTPKTQDKTTDPADIYAPDPSTLLFQVSYTSRWMGANASGNLGHALLLDLRAGEPKVLRHLECTTGEGGGVCTAPDSGYGSRASVTCAWKGSGYVCDERVVSSTGWGERFTESSYDLLSGKDAYVPPAEAIGVEAVPDRLSRRKADGQKYLVPDIGEVTAIYSVIQGEHDLYVLAARGIGSTPDLAFAGGTRLDARFYLVERPHTDRPAISVELKPSTASALVPIGFVEAEMQRQQASKPAPPPVSSRAGGAPLSYNVKRLSGDDSFFVLQVTVKEGNGHAVYWIGVDQRSSPIIADQYRLASDASPYYHCMMFIQEEGVTSYRLLPGAGFRAALEVEPMHITDEEGNFYPDPEGETQAPGKACTKRISWDRAKGFVFAEHPVCRTVPPRAIAISDTGQITVKPMPAAPSR